MLQTMKIAASLARWTDRHIAQNTAHNYIFSWYHQVMVDCHGRSKTRIVAERRWFATTMDADGRHAMNATHSQSDSCVAERQRLFDQLDEAVRSRVTVVTAPDGYGKSTLLRSWAARTDLDVSFLSLESLDVPRFLESLCTCCPTEQTPQRLGADDDPLPLMVDILNGLATQSDQWVLILDDYVPSHSLDNVLCFLIEYLPPYAHLIIAGEVFPEITCLPRMRVRRELREITAGDLLFGADETSSLLERCAQVRVGRDEVQRLLSQTRGRAADLKRHVKRLLSTDDPDAPQSRPVTELP